MEIRIPKDARSIIDKLTEAGYEAYIVGGCVRDCLLGLTPDDWDITTNALPEQVKELFRRTIDTGIEHGTVTVMIGNEGYEVTTYRTDGAYSDGRHPDKVTFVPSLEEDLKRRDFTINAMAYNDRDGLVDLFGGRDDIAGKTVRCVGRADERFSEDALRMMRAVRFAAKLGYRIDEEAIASIKKLAPTLSKVSAERITVELTKLLASDHPEMLETLYETGLTKVFFPELDKAYDTPQVHPHHRFDVGRHIVESVRFSKNDRIVRFAMLLHDIGKPDTLTIDDKGITHFRGHPGLSAKMGEEIMRRWKLDNDTIFRVCRLIKHHDMSIGHTCTPPYVRKAVSVMEEDFPRLLDVMRADVLAQSDYLRQEKLDTIGQYAREYERIMNEGECCSLKQLAVGGRDLIAAGMTPGPAMGEILGKLLERVLEDPSLNDRAKLLSIAKEYI